MADDLNILAAAIYVGAHIEEQAAAANRFPDALIELLPTADVRDKPARNENGNEIEAKLGIFDRNGVIKPEYEQYLLDLYGRIRQFFDGNS